MCRTMQNKTSKIGELSFKRFITPGHYTPCFNINYGQSLPNNHRVVIWMGLLGDYFNVSLYTQPIKDKVFEITQDLQLRKFWSK